jgi:hypothetical protein
MDRVATAAKARVPKTVEFDRDQFEELDALRIRTRRPNFSEAVRLAVRHGIAAIEQLEAEGRLVA